LFGPNVVGTTELIRLALTRRMKRSAERARHDEWFTRSKTAQRALPEQRRQHSLLPLLHVFEKPGEPALGSAVLADRFTDALQEAGIDEDGPSRTCPPAPSRSMRATCAESASSDTAVAAGPDRRGAVRSRQPPSPATVANIRLIAQHVPSRHTAQPFTTCPS
jgi:hypothetical protein